MSDAGVTSTRCTVWPLMSIPRIASALAATSSGVWASFTPPALPGGGASLVHRLGDHSRQHRNTMRGEQLLRLVLIQIHSTVSPDSAPSDERTLARWRPGRHVASGEVPHSR